MKPPNINDYRHVLIYQSMTETRNGQLQAVDVPTDHSTHRAAIEGLNGRELLALQQMQGTATHKIRIRHPRFIPAVTDRFYQPSTGRVYQIRSVLDRVGDGRELTIIADEQTSGAS